LSRFNDKPKPLGKQCLVCNIFDYSNDGIFVIDPHQYKILSVNNRACALFGYRQEEFLAKPISSIFPNQMSELENFAQMVLRLGKSQIKEIEFQKKSGEYIPVEISASTLEFGGDFYVIALIRDISDRKQAEKALLESERMLSTLMKNLPGMAYRCKNDKNWTMEFVSEGCLELCGYESDDIIENRVKSYAALIHPDDQKYVWEQVQRAIGDKKQFEMEYRIKCKDGQEKWVWERGVGIFSEDGSLIRLEGFISDITERKKTNEALTISEKRFRTLFEQAAVGVAQILTNNGRFVKVNQKYCDIVGYTKDEMLITTLQEITHPDDLENDLEKMALLRGGKISEFSLEKRYFHKMGHIVWVNLTVSVMGSPGEESDYLIMVAEDISEKKKGEVALRNSEERLNRILESAMDAIITFDEKMNIKLLNVRAEKVFGCIREQMLNQSIEPLLSPEFQTTFKNYFYSYKNNNGEKPYLSLPTGTTAHRLTGEIFPIEGTISCAKVFDQKLFTIILRDITNRIKQEEAVQKLERVNIFLQEEIHSIQQSTNIIGKSKVIKDVFKKIKSVSQTDSTVLIIGETGTGKELIAKAIHNESKRKNKILVTVNCASIPSGLIESEFFGHEKGAFTGAFNKKIGRFEISDGGTIFLDEIGDMPLDLQAKLLRVLQEGEFIRVGGTQPIKVDVRVIAATNKDLSKATKEGLFREDLFFRLNVFPIIVPPLRQRSEDIPLLINHFVKLNQEKMGKIIETIPSQSMDALMGYSWPGNIRELENIIERAVIITQGNTLEIDDQFLKADTPPVNSTNTSLKDLERNHIIETLNTVGWKVSGERGAAKILGLKPTTLEAKMKKLEIYRQK
jgi:formate hydrogenlyase transcriptional activator